MCALFPPEFRRAAADVLNCDEPVRLTLRFQHAATSALAASREAGFDVRAERTVTLPAEAGRPVEGLLVVPARRDGAAA